MKKSMISKNVFPRLIRIKVIFQDFPDLGISKKKISGLCRKHGNPGLKVQ